MTLIQRVADMALIAQETGGSVMQMLEQAGIDVEEIEVLADGLMAGDDYETINKNCPKF